MQPPYPYLLLIYIALKNSRYGVLPLQEIYNFTEIAFAPFVKERKEKDEKRPDKLGVSFRIRWFSEESQRLRWCHDWAGAEWMMIRRVL
jgi:hypothetical protein